jgi:glutathione S-transferase
MPAMALKLYSWPKSSGTKVHWALEELGLPYETVTLDEAKREHKTAAFLAINPNGKVPALVDDGVPYFESLAILLHLAEKYGVEKGLWPKGGRERADALCWSVWALAELNFYMMQYVYHGLDSPVSYKPDQRSKATADYTGWQLGNMLDVLERRLADRDFVVGPFSLADIAIASVLGTGKKLGADLGARPRVVAWLERCETRPACTKAL